MADALSHLEIPKATEELRKKGFTLVWVDHGERIGMGGEGMALIDFVRKCEARVRGAILRG